MIFDPATGVHLKPWLVRTLEPICDAEPGALADYLLALLKHNVPEAEMRKELTVQLDEFLEKAECQPFIDTLFTVLRTKSYLPYGTAPSTSAFPTNSGDGGIPIPIPATKGPRLSSEGQFSRYSNGRGGGPDSRSTGGWGARVDRPPANGYHDPTPQMNPGGMGMNGNGRRPLPYLPPDQKRGICRDYHNNGYCSRGAYCKFSHGDDAVVPGQLFPMNAAGGMPFMPMFPAGGASFGMPGGAGPAYDPHEARMDMRPPPTNGAVRPQPRAPLIPRAQQEGGSRMRSGELPVIQDLTPPVHDAPTSPLLDRPRQLPPHLSPSSQMNSLPPENYNGYDSSRNGMNGHPMNGHSAMLGPQMDVDMSNSMDMGGPAPHHHPGGGFRGGRGGPRGKGVFNGEVHKFNPERRNDKTLVVEKIPDDKLTLEHVNDWFKRFGKVTNVAIDSSSAKALVSFENHEEAHAAWKSEDAVFNNRFVKLFWHRPMEGHGQVGARMLAASAPVVANIVKPEPAPAAAPALSTPSRPVATPARKTPSSASTALAAKQQLLEKQIAEQKALMAKLSTASPQEKKEIMGRLRKLGEEMTAAPAATPATPVVVKEEDREQKERERLDKELELHSATAKVEEEESTEDLKAKLERLKAEAVSLGLSDTGAPETSWGAGSYRPYRGRARGARSYYRGAGPVRGGAPRASMKLDNRPKKLIVKGVKEDSTQAVRDWYETTGQVEWVTTVESGDIVVTFRTRSGAEQGLAKGNNISLVGPVQVSWYTGPAVEATTTPTSAAALKREPGIDIDLDADAATLSQDALDSDAREEEVVASGWGDEDEDGMGML
ncbi:hypothetical protein K438DRAFT_1803787 [Mycena galopus ATCC 62051]|nr:hypothetical protein K438DRAFT_1803787 [Mycena galopus ATCC 62051]